MAFDRRQPGPQTARPLAAKAAVEAAILGRPRTHVQPPPPPPPPRFSDSYSPQSLPARSLTLTEPSPANPGPDSPAVMLYDVYHLPALDPRLRAPLSSPSNCWPRSFSWPPYPASCWPETDSATAAAPEAGAQDAARHLSVSSGESGELAVSRKAPSSDGGSEIAGYKVQWTLLQGHGYGSLNREVTPC